MTRVLTRKQALSCISAREGHRIEPRMLADGRQGVSEWINTLPVYSDISGILDAGSVETFAEWSAHTTTTILVHGKPMTLNNARRSYSISEPSDNVFRQEVRANDYGTPTDLANGNRRSEIVSSDADGAKSGETIWAAFSCIRGKSSYVGSGVNPLSTFLYIMQFHPINRTITLPPCVSVDYYQNNIRIFTTSEDEAVDGRGVFKLRYTGALPEIGEVTNYVISLTPGENGHLKVWINGSVVYDADIPISYWSGLNLGTDVIAKPQFGIYQRNIGTNDVVYHANIEFSKTSLESRVASPIAVPDLSPWA